MGTTSQPGISLLQVRRRIHAVRVSLLRASQRLGYDAEHGLVKQVLYRQAARCLPLSLLWSGRAAC